MRRLIESLEGLAEAKEVRLSMSDQIEQNAKQKAGDGVKITSSIYDWLTKKFGKGSSVTITSRGKALSAQRIEIDKSKGRMGSVKIVITPFGDYIRVHDDQGGAGSGKSTYFSP